MAESAVLALQCQISSSVANDMRCKRELIDVTLICGNQSFPAHRVILSAGSSFFRLMFLSGMEESNSRQVELKGMNPDALATVIDVIYGKSFTVDKDNNEALQALIAAAHMLQVYPLYEHCCQEFLQKLNSDYFLDIWTTAEMFQNIDMLQVIPGLLAQDFLQVQCSSDFLMLSPNQMKQLLYYANQKGKEADDLVRGLLAWVKRDPASRQEHLAPLFANIDLSSLTPPFLSQLFMTEDLVKKSLELMSSLMAVATSRMILAQAGGQSQTRVDLPRKKDIKILFISGRDGETAMQYFDVESNEWSIVMNMPFVISGLSDASQTGAYVQKKLFIIGGKNPLVYKPFTTRIHPLNSIPDFPAEHAWSVVLNEKIYYIGGVGGNGKIQRYVQCYDPAADEWEMKAPTRNEFYHPNAVALGEYIYVVDSQNFVVERYDPASNRWVIINPPDMDDTEESVNYWQVPIAACSNKLFVYDRRRCLWSYDPSRNKWKVCHCDIERVIKGMWGVSTNQTQLHYFLIMDDEGVLYQYDPTIETCERCPGSMEFMGKGWCDVLLV